MKSVSAFAPATVANLNVGFDVMGLALHTIGDEVTVTINGTNQNAITSIINGDGLPTSVEKNCCSVVIDAMQKDQGIYIGVDISIVKGFASGSGLGSSSASSAAAAVAYNELIGSPYTTKQLVIFASKGEEIACGASHKDNVAPAILGGWILVTEHDLIQLPMPSSIYLNTLFPSIEINTKQARNLLGDTIHLEKATRQTAHIAGFISGLYEKNTEQWSTHMKDFIAEPKRKELIPNFDALKNCAIQNGAIAFGISGSGPSMFAISRTGAEAEIIELELAKEIERLNMAAKINSFDLSNSMGATITNIEE